ncbi:MAG: hypothetical protein AAGH88_12225 [Planctomycetota bacterium]
MNDGEALSTGIKTVLTGEGSGVTGQKVILDDIQPVYGAMCAGKAPIGHNGCSVNF